MADQNITKQPISPDEIKKMVVEALNIGHLTPAEQEKIMSELGGALIERATLALLKELPEEEFEKIDALAGGEKDAEMVVAIQKAVPNAQQIMEDAIKTGIVEYKDLVNEQVEKRLAAEKK